HEIELTHIYVLERNRILTCLLPIEAVRLPRTDVVVQSSHRCKPKRVVRIIDWLPRRSRSCFRHTKGRGIVRLLVRQLVVEPCANKFSDISIDIHGEIVTLKP